MPDLGCLLFGSTIRWVRCVHDRDALFIAEQGYNSLPFNGTKDLPRPWSERICIPRDGDLTRVSYVQREIVIAIAFDIEKRIQASTE